MKNLFLLLMCTLYMSLASNAADREFYEIKVYYLDNKEQEQRVDAYLKDAFLPALHRMGLDRIGVFKPIGNDTSSNKRIYVLIPIKKLTQVAAIDKKLQKDKDYLQKGKDYIETAYNQPAYRRMETIILQAFTNQPVAQKPNLKGPSAQRVYELRSYEGASEKLYNLKVEMFNVGEVALFKRLGFNAIFYGEVLAGCTMPNLMYMTSFENMQERDAHWKSFTTDPAWKVLSAEAKYQHTVSKNVTSLLYPVDYSDL